MSKIGKILECMEMGKVARIVECQEESCVYNSGKECRTPGINVGSKHPECDTFMKGGEKAGFGGMKGIVGSCKVTDCVHNSAMECSMDAVKIGDHNGHPDCLTFKMAER